MTRPLRTAAPLAALIAASLLGCDGTISRTDEDAGLASTPCETPLTLSPERTSVAPQGIAIFTAGGGTGSYAFSLGAASSTGGRIDERSGVFVAGTTMGADEIVVRDRRCAGEARAVVTTTVGFAISPSRIELEPAGTVTFVTTGGVGEPTYTLLRAASGGTLDAAGRYTAGTTLGEDVVRATDRSGASADAIVVVTTDASLRPVHELIGLAPGAGFTPRIEGGSGVFDLTGAGAAVALTDGRLRGVMAGRNDIAVRDTFTAQTATLRGRTGTRLEASSTYVGDRSELTRIFIRDVDGDAIPDAVVGMAASNLGPIRGGAVLIYRGTASGLETTPARTLVGQRRDDNFGISLEVADLDGDGRVELLVGAWQADNTGGNAGAVYVYRGVADRLFSETPMQILTGVVANDRFGASMTVCDLDGDGDQDIVVGAADSENRDRTPRLLDQGSIFIHENVGGTILASPTQTIHGESFLWTGEPPSVVRSSHASMRFGTWMSSGDFDGDGRCDVAVYSERPLNGTSADGAVSVFRGRAAAGELRGGLEPTPMLYVSGTTTTSRLGRSLAFGDLDGDGRDELAIGQYNFDKVVPSMTTVSDVGAVRVFRGRVAGAETFVPRADEADLSIVGEVASEQVGVDVAIGDATGDGRPDLIMGNARLTPMGSELTRPGAVRVFAGRPDALPSESATRVISGTRSEERFGWGVAPLVLPGGRNDRLLAYALYGRDGVMGPTDVYDTGRLSVVAGTDALSTVWLPIARGGRRLGQAVAALDLNRDGVVDLAVGAPLEAFSGMNAAGGELRGGQVGAVHVYTGSASGGVATWPSTPSFTLRGFAAHTEFDQFGDQLLAAGDYDEDGAQDLLVISRLEDARVAQAAPYALEAGCNFGDPPRDDVGAALLFRGGASVSAASAPALAIFGPEATRPFTSMATLDFDGDGALDVALGGSTWIAGTVRGGGVWIVSNRDLSGGTPPAVCAPDTAFYGMREADDFGAAMVSLGDLDGDGCDDLAVGAPRAERRAGAPATLSNEGMVAILFGGGACGSPRPTIAWLASGDANSNAGAALAAGDLDGDGRRELVVGARTFRNGVGEIGRVYVFDGDRLAALKASASVSPDAGMPSDAGARDAGPSLIDGGVAGGAFDSISAAVIEGLSPGERLGTSVAITRYRGMPVVAMGAPWADTSGAPDTGGVRFARWSAGTLRYVAAAIGGEDDEEGTELGSSLVAFMQGGSPYVLVGAPWSNVGVPFTATTTPPYAHEGAAYVIDLGD